MSKKLMIGKWLNPHPTISSSTFKWRRECTKWYK